MKLVQISPNEHGCYFVYQVEVQRGIRGKNKGKVKELLIVGVPKNQLNSYCKREGVRIENSLTGEKYGF